MPSISIETKSPALSQHGCGLAAMPTPCGIPVRMTVPGRSVVLPLKYSIKVGTLKIMSLVVQSCRRSSLRMVAIFEALGSGTSSRVTSLGPGGAKVSKNLPRHH